RRLVAARNGRVDEVDFRVEPEPVPREFSEHVSSLARVTRLREVRALTGFTRLEPWDGVGNERIAALAVRRQPWLPAIEIRGEGIFMSLDDEMVRQWESRTEVIARLNELSNRTRADSATTDPPTARHVLLHTVAHILM